MASWWQGTEAIRSQLTSGVQSIKKATQDIANELAEVDDIDEDDNDQELHYDTNDQILRFQQMYQELQSAYNEQEKELHELRSVNEINQNSSHKASDQLHHSQQRNIKLKQEYETASNAINELELKIDQLSCMKPSDNASSESERNDIIEQLSKKTEEYHDFKKKTKAKWDEVKGKFQTQRQNFKDLEKENKDLKMKIEEMETKQLDLNVLKERKLEDDRIYNEEINTLKEESKHRLNDITQQFEAIQHKLEESNTKCIGFEQQMHNDKQAMILLSKQHNQYKVLVEEEKIEITKLRDEIERNKDHTLQQLSTDDRIKNIIQNLKDENNELNNTISVLQNKIGCITSSFEAFRDTVSSNLRSIIRPSVALIEEEHDELRNKYEIMEAKYRKVTTELVENKDKYNKIKQEYEVQISRLKDEYECNESSRNEIESEYESFRTQSMDLENGNMRLKQSNHTLKQEIANLENQMKDSMDQYKTMLQNKENEYTNLCHNLYTILSKNDVLNDDNGAIEGEKQYNDTKSIKRLLLSLDEWVQRIQMNEETNTENEENIDIIMKECNISSRVLAIRLLNDHNNDVSTAIFEYNQALNEDNDNELIVNQLQESNNNLSRELNAQQQQYSDLQKLYISACNNLDETTNKYTELEEENEGLHLDNEEYQRVLEETRIETQDVIDNEQQRNDELLSELSGLADEKKVLMAQKRDLTKELHSKLKNDDSISTQRNLQNEICALNKDKDRLKLNLNALKEENKKNLREKDEDIIELNTMMNELKLENEELNALESDYIDLKKKYNQQNDDLEMKRTAFNNLQTAFDALQIQFSKLKSDQISNCGANAEGNRKELRVNDDDGDNDELNELRLKYESVTKQFQDVRTKLTQSQKYQIRLEHETASLRSTISKTAIKLKNLSSSDDQVDRRIIIKLLVTFFDRWYNGGDTKEVITLIAKILKFNERERKKCRIIERNTNTSASLWGYAASWISSSSSSYQENENVIESPQTPSKDLGSLWVEFLLSELGDNEEKTEIETDTETDTETETKIDDDITKQHEMTQTHTNMTHSSS